MWRFGMEERMERESMEVRVYTRQPRVSDYPPGLAYSVHMAFRTGEEEYKPWNKNYGILFAEALIRMDDTLDTKALKHPRIYETAVAVVPSRLIGAPRVLVGRLLRGRPLVRRGIPASALVGD